MAPFRYGGKQSSQWFRMPSLVSAMQVLIASASITQLPVQVTSSFSLGPPHPPPPPPPVLPLVVPHKHGNISSPSGLRGMCEEENVVTDHCRRMQISPGAASVMTMVREQASLASVCG